MHTFLGKQGAEGAEGNKIVIDKNMILLFCGSGAENNTVQTLKSAVSLLNDKHSNIDTQIFVGKTY